MENVVEVLEGALSLVEAQTRIKHVELVRDFAAGLPPVYVDRHRIQQVIINLCINAMDAMPKGGKIKIRAALIPGTKQPPGVEISVSDTGTGISPAIRERIFEPFFTTKEKGRGTGLGLCLVREIVREHKGKLEVLSELGDGTTFTIRLAAATRSP
jgi:signal transduction histidine kinase